jgi:signal transduction histidine kinase
MDTTQPLPPERRTALPWWVSVIARWLGIVAVALLVMLVILIEFVRPASDDLAALIGFLGGGSIVSMAFGVTAFWVIHRLRGRLWLKLAIPSLLAAAVIALNVIIIGHLMLLSPNDSIVIYSVLGFAIVLALTLASSIAGTMSAALSHLEAGAQHIAAGEYHHQIPENEAAGLHEISQLARWFNQMARSIADAFTQRERMEQHRQAVIAALSHDVRTPIAAMRAMIEAIDDGVVTDPETIRRYHQAIRGEMQHLTMLMTDLFEASRIEAGALRLERQAIAVGDLISEVLAANAETAQRYGIHLAGYAGTDLPPISADAGQLYRVLHNLTCNALEHTPSGGAIWLEASREDARHIRLMVMDSGTGIAATDLPHVFEMAYRGEASRRRTNITGASGGGLGLAIVRGIVAAHEGTVAALSPLPNDLRMPLADMPATGPGTAIQITLPIVPERDPR